MENDNIESVESTNTVEETMTNEDINKSDIALDASGEQTVSGSVSPVESSTDASAVTLDSETLDTLERLTDSSIELTEKITDGLSGTQDTLIDTVTEMSVTNAVSDVSGNNPQPTTTPVVPPAQLVTPADVSTFSVTEEPEPLLFESDISQYGVTDGLLLIILLVLIYQTFLKKR